MALTETQEKQLLEGHETFKKTIAELQPLAAQVPELKKSLEVKEAEIAELKKGHSTLTQDSALSAFKSAYPDVPESVFHSTAPDKREAVAKELQSKLKPSGKSDPNDTLSLWTRTGGIGPSDDATLAAENAAKLKKIEEGRKEANPLKMLAAKGGEIARHLAQTIRAPITSK